MDLTSTELLIPLLVGLASVGSAFYAVKLNGAKNETAIKNLHERLEILAKQITALFVKKDASVETEVEVKHLRREMDKLLDWIHRGKD
jgi:hypothetical protein